MCNYVSLGYRVYAGVKLFFFRSLAYYRVHCTVGRAWLIFFTASACFALLSPPLPLSVSHFLSRSRSRSFSIFLDLLIFLDLPRSRYFSVFLDLVRSRSFSAFLDLIRSRSFSVFLDLIRSRSFSVFPIPRSFSVFPIPRSFSIFLDGSRSFSVDLDLSRSISILSRCTSKRPRSRSDSPASARRR